MTTPAPGSTPAETVSFATVLTGVHERIATGQGLTSAEVAAMSEGELKAWGEALGQVRREVNAMVARVAHGQAQLSTANDGANGMARRNGKPTPHDLVASQTGESEREAKKLIEIGQTLADAEKDAALQKDVPAKKEASPADGAAQPPEPPRFPSIAAATDKALIGIEAAAMIQRMLERVHDVADPQSWRDAERTLVAKAKLLNLRALSRAVRRTEANLFQAGVKQREDKLRDARYLHIFEDNTGMVVINGKLDPETAAPIKAAVDGLVDQGLQARAGKKSITQDERTPTQMRADALALLARHSLKCDNEELGLAGVTVVVRMDVDSLLESVDSLEPAKGGQGVAGVGEIDGIAQPITAGAARRIAGEAGVVPVVTKGASVALDVGRNRYHFSPAQKLALIERDGGCAMCGVPPSWCEAHHIQEWSAQSGKTDVANGVMLCRRCHQDLHNQGWTVKATLTETWFTPPAHIDPHRRPQPGGRMLHGGALLDADSIERIENAAKSPDATAGFQFSSGSTGSEQRGSVSKAGAAHTSAPDELAQNRAPTTNDEPPPLTLCHRASSPVAVCSARGYEAGTPRDSSPGAHRFVLSATATPSQHGSRVRSRRSIAGP